MINSISRIISKAGFLLVIMGFYKPIVLDMDAVQISKGLASLVPANINDSIAYSLGALFLLSHVGVLIGILLLVLLIIKKDFNIGIDWIIIIVSVIEVIIIYYRILPFGSPSFFAFDIPTALRIIPILSYLDKSIGFGSLFRDLVNIQSGAYMIIIGLIISIIFNFIASFHLILNAIFKFIKYCKNNMEDL